MQRCRLLGVFLLSVVLMTTGCLQQRILVLVEPDGSGRIVLSRYYTPEGVRLVEASIQQMEAAMESGQMPMSMNMSTNIFFNQAGIERQSALFGPGATFVKARPIDKGGNKGFAAVYAFDRVEDLRIPYDLQSSIMAISTAMISAPGMDGLPVEPADTVDFLMDREAGTLTLDLPGFVEEAPTPPSTNAMSEAEIEQMRQGLTMMGPTMGGENPLGLTGEESPEEIFGMMYGNSAFRLEVQLAGEVEDVPASLPSEKRPNRFTLYSLTFEEMDQHLGALSGLEDSPMVPGSQNMLHKLHGFPGVQLETNRTIVIRYAK